jgi:hypothetical protein
LQFKKAKEDRDKNATATWDASTFVTCQVNAVGTTGLEKGDVLLDNQANVSIMHPSLLSAIKRADAEICVNGVGGVQLVTDCTRYLQDFFRGVILKIVLHISDSQYLAVNKFVLASLLGLYYHIHCRFILYGLFRASLPTDFIVKKSIEEINCACACVPFLVILLGISSSHDCSCITFLVIVQELVVVVTMLALCFLSLCQESVVVMTMLALHFLSFCWELVITAFFSNLFLSYLS